MEIGTGRITFGGLSTGIDTAALVEGLLAVERASLGRIESQRSDVETKQGLFRDLNTLLLDVRNAALSLDNLNATQTGASLDEEFLAYQATSANEGVVVASSTGTGNPTPGTYAVTVSSLAAVGRDISTSFADPAALMGGAGDTFSVGFGNGTGSIDVTLDPAGISLDGLRDAINSSPDNDGSVRAEVLFDGTSYRLIVSGTQAGSASDIAVSTTLSGGAFVDAALSSDATDATLNVFGVDITRSTNSISDAIAGVTLDLVAPGTSSVTVARDDSEIVDRVQTLIDAVNAVRSFSDGQSAVDENTQRGGPLSGDPLLRRIGLQVSSLLARSFDFGSPDAVDSLSLIGVRTGDDGLLSLDQGVLSSKLDSDPLGVRRLFSGDGTTSGVAVEISQYLEPIVRSGDGALAVRDDSYDDQIAVLSDSITRFEQRLAQREQTLLLRFSAMETAVARLQAQSSFLAGLQAPSSSSR